MNDKHTEEQWRRCDLALNMLIKSARWGDQVVLESDEAMLIMKEIERLRIELSVYKLRDAGMLED